MNITTTPNMTVDMDSHNHANMSGVVSEENVGTVAIVVIVIQFTLSVFIVAGNILTILAVHRTKRLHTVANRYVVSLAVADLMAGLVLPFYAIKLLPGVNNAFNTNRYLCLSSFVVLIISAGNSMTTMVQIAVDRLLYIVYPLRYSRIATTFRANVIISTSWIFAVIVGTMPLYYNNWKDEDRTHKCDVFEVLTKEFQVYIQFVVFCLCCLVAGFCYCCIFKISYHQRKSLVDVQRVRKESCESRSTVEIMSTFRREWPMIKMFVLVYGVFFVCWCPSMLGIVLGNFMEIPSTMMNMFVALCLLNSGMNFIIYGVKNKDFRGAYFRLLCGRRFENGSNINSSIRSGSNNGFLLK